jgi:predicted DNA-binding protein (MmcQ/YjbR family)
MEIKMAENNVKQYLLAKAETTLGYPFGDEVMVFKVKNKMFATLALGTIAKGVDKTDDDKKHWWMNLKCDPDEAVMLRDIFPAIIPGYHMDKRLWITIILDGSVPQGEVERLMDNSYLLVVSKMSKKDQQSILVHL